MKVRILVVDDDGSKIEAVRALVAATILDGAELTVAGSVSEGAEVLREASCDVLIMDLNVPMHRGGAPVRDGGIRMLDAIERGIIKRPAHIIGLSSYPDLVASHAARFREALWHVVEFSNDSREWELPVAERLAHVAASKSPPPGGEYAIDVAIITALHEVELQAVLECPAGWKQETFSDDATIYNRGRVNAGSARVIEVVAAAAPEMGMVASACLAMKVIHRYRPRLLLMCGIAAGVKGAFGDVLIAEATWNYEAGKIRAAADGTREFLPAPTQIGLDPVLHARLSVFRLSPQKWADLQYSWKGQRPEQPMAVHFGPVASGSAVIELRDVVDAAVAQHRKLLGIEMETFGVYSAAKYANAPRPLAVSMKSICDFADPDKADDFQRYAAYTSAAFAFRFVQDYFANPTESGSGS